MKRIGTLALVVGCVLVSGGMCNAGEFIARWEEPTKYSNGLPLDRGSIRMYGLRYVNTITLKYGMRYPRVGSTSLLQQVEPGTYRVDMRTYLLDGNRSDWSQPVLVTVK